MKIESLNQDLVSNNIITTSLIPYTKDIIPKQQKKMQMAVKRGIDIIGAILGIIMLIPLTIIIYIVNLLSKEHGPIFYAQERIGQNGKLFKMYKFRSMVLGADEKLKIYLEENEEAREQYKKYKKLPNDPRITKIGRFIRKTSIDEFPQFINVLKGEMSLVGPRPYLPREKEEMNGYYKYIIQCKPGITGYWQINGRSEVTFDDRIDMDMKYYYTNNLKQDITILAKTVKKIIKKEGAE